MIRRILCTHTKNLLLALENLIRYSISCINLELCAPMMKYCVSRNQQCVQQPKRCSSVESIGAAMACLKLLLIILMQIYRHKLAKTGLMLLLCFSRNQSTMMIKKLLQGSQESQRWSYLSHKILKFRFSTTRNQREFKCQKSAPGNRYSLFTSFIAVIFPKERPKI